MAEQWYYQNVQYMVVKNKVLVGHLLKTKKDTSYIYKNELDKAYF